MTTLLTCFLVRFESSHDILSKVPSRAHLSYVSWYSLMFPAGGKLLLWGQIPSPSQVSDHKSLRRLWTPHFVPVQGGKVCVFKRDWASVFFWPLLCRGVEFWRFSHWITCAWELMVYSLSALFHASLAHQSYRSIYSPNNQTVFPAHTKVLQPSARINLRERVLLWCYSNLLQCFLLQVRDISCGSWHMMALTAGQYSATHPYTVNSHGGRLENISSRLTNEPIRDLILSFFSLFRSSASSPPSKWCLAPPQSPSSLTFPLINP